MCRVLNFCGGCGGRGVRGIPFVHLVEVLFVGVDDEVGSFLLVLEVLVGDDAGELEDLVGFGVEAAHFEVDPQKPGAE